MSRTISYAHCCRWFWHFWTAELGTRLCDPHQVEVELKSIRIIIKVILLSFARSKHQRMIITFGNRTGFHKGGCFDAREGGEEWKCVTRNWCRWEHLHREKFAIAKNVVTPWIRGSIWMLWSVISRCANDNRHVKTHRDIFHYLIKPFEEIYRGKWKFCTPTTSIILSGPVLNPEQIKVFYVFKSSFRSNHSATCIAHQQESSFPISCTQTTSVENFIRVSTGMAPPIRSSSWTVSKHVQQSRRKTTNAAVVCVTHCRRFPFIDFLHHFVFHFPCFLLDALELLNVNCQNHRDEKKGAWVS